MTQHDTHQDAIMPRSSQDHSLDTLARSRDHTLYELPRPALHLDHLFITRHKSTQGLPLVSVISVLRAIIENRTVGVDM